MSTRYSQSHVTVSERSVDACWLRNVNNEGMYHGMRSSTIRSKAGMRKHGRMADSLSSEPLTHIWKVRTRGKVTAGWSIESGPATAIVIFRDCNEGACCCRNPRQSACFHAILEQKGVALTSSSRSSSFVKPVMMLQRCCPSVYISPLIAKPRNRSR
ncbi:unnamed protein product [Mycena citricolor]|uniref:Uncharacterized protein n=1 Tax=Mycena citricolor TaxID=2018698 RepID=A0AAD2H1V5_9AGAR|nr:unnamed protein product [Mycena citricolor]